MQVDLPPAERVAAAVEAFAAWHARHHRVARVVQYELGSLSEDDYRDVAAMRRRMQGRVR